MTFTLISDIIQKWTGWCPNSRSMMREPFTALEKTGQVKNSPHDDKGNTLAPSWIKDGSIQVALTSAACLLILCVVLKNILLIPPDQLNRDISIWIIIFMGLGISDSLMKNRNSSDKKRQRTQIWCILIVATMLGIIGIYAL